MEPGEIEEAAQAPKKTAGDEGSIEERSIDELIQADRYEQAKQAGANGPPYGMRKARFKKPGTP